MFRSRAHAISCADLPARSDRTALAGRTARSRTGRGALAVLLAAAVAVTGLVAGPRFIGQATARAVAGSPAGAAEHMWFRPGGMRLIGWAVDPNTTNPISVYATVDGRKVASSVADRARTDLTSTHPTGVGHGFYLEANVPEGVHTICVTAADVGAGADTQLRCQTRTMDYGPIGALDYLRAAPGSLTVKGWAFDYDQPTAPITVGFVVDGVVTQFVAADPRSDVARKYPTAGSAHGFTLTLSAAQGMHRVCLQTVNVGYGSDNVLDCRTVTLAESPRGHVSLVAVQKGKVRVQGWALDPDAFPSASTVTVSLDGAAHRVLANLPRSDVAAHYPTAGPRHGYDLLLTAAEGTHTVCITARNVSYGSDTSFGCRSVTVHDNPSAALYTPAVTTSGVLLGGWAEDPDTRSPISVRITTDGVALTVLANRVGASHSGHKFLAAVRLTSGTHRICAVGLNVLYGTHNSAPACHTISLAFTPFGRLDSVRRDAATGGLQITGWAIDGDTTRSITVRASIDGGTPTLVHAALSRPDVASHYPVFGPLHGYQTVLPADAGEHQICVTAVNVGPGGADKPLGCRVVTAVNPTVPAAPRSAAATPSFGAATITWSPPVSDGGAPWTKYVVTASPGGASTAVGPTTTTATLTGLKSNAVYTFSVVAVNAVGTSPAAVTAAVTTLSGPPPQRTPAPVSTSRYIRNIRGSSATELSVMRAEGAADAQANPAGHAYLQLLDIGGQDDYDGGVVLSATTRFVSYGDLLRDVQAYLDGYHSAQRASAPVTIAIGTNNDMDVSASSGRNWADRVIDPLVSYAARYSNMRIAGANDIEPGFRATYSQTKAWLAGYLGATSAPFIFNGSADGCAWTVTNRSCNNGWSMAGLYYVSQGAAPTRSTNLPQIYNSTMAGQWKYISLTGVEQGQPRINFGGPLTEWTACAQAGSCGSLTGHTAWSMMWNNLQSDSRLKVSSLPYSTDLRIDR